MALRHPQRPCEFHIARSISGHSRVALAASVSVLVLVLLFAGSAAAAAGETARERCQSMSAQAARADAIAACDEAVTRSGSAQDMWAAATVRVTRAEAPTMDDLIRADLLAAGATRLAPGEPWGYLARLDIARRWGDAELIERRLDEPERPAPPHPRPLQAIVAARAAAGPGASLVLGWAALLLGCALTLAHALRLRRGARVRTRAPVVLRALVVGALLLASPRLSHATVAEPFSIDDAHPDHDVPTPAQADARPLDFAYYLQEVSTRADAATRRGDHAAAARYYRALARAVPDSALPAQKLCASLVALGETDDAIAACQDALGLPGVRVEDFGRFADLVLGKSAPSAAELHDVEAAARHLAGQPDSRRAGLQLECRLGVRTASITLLEECTAGLAIVAPDDASTYVFEWSLAQQKGRSGEARRLVEQARAAGLGADALARMQAATDSRIGAASTSRPLLVGVGLVTLLLGVVLVVLAVRARRVRRQWMTTISGNV